MRKYHLLKRLILKTRNSLKGRRMNDLSSAFPELFQASKIMRGMTAKELNSFGLVKDGVITIDLNDMIRARRHDKKGIKV